MPIFGQVWLWSSLAFLLGAVLCWLLVARPARNRVGELEAQLATRARRQPAPERPEPSRRHEDEAEFSRAVAPGLGEAQTEADSDYLTRSYALRESPPPLPERPKPQDQDFSEPELFGVFDSEPQSQPATPSSAATQYLDVSAGSLTAPPEVPPSSPPPSDRGWFDDELEGDVANKGPEEQPAVPRNRHHMTGPFVDDDMDDNLDDNLDDDQDFHDALDDEPESSESMADPRAAEEPRPAIQDTGGTIFTQHTQPIPRELIRQIDDADNADQAQPDSLVDDLADDGADDQAEPEFARTVESEPVERPEDPAAAEHEAQEATPTVPPESPAEQTEIVSATRESNDLPRREKPTDQPHETSELPRREKSSDLPRRETTSDLPRREKSNELPRRVPMQSRMPGVAVRVDPTPNALPKRVPGKPRHQVPFGIQADSVNEQAAPSAPASVTVAEDDQPATPRSLFEPIVPAADEGTSTPPPPHRLRQAGTGGRGPFGPGSAMPLPGGASPSPEFTIKASVAALRYCTPESPQFGRTVAEVWFRTAADAERVGFRPVG